MATHFGLASPWSAHWANRVLDQVLRAGWVGVDLFFVLSGFLITGILVDARGQARYFRNFYGRRSLRIFPIYYVWLAALMLVIPTVFGARPEWQAIRGESVWYWLYLSNVRAALFGWPEGDCCVGHFWSLAIEEQFYLVWPLLILLMSRRAMIRCCVCLMVGALVFRVVLHSTGATTAAYVLMPARVDALALGGLVALAARNPRGLWRYARWIRWMVAFFGVSVVGLFIVNGRAHPQDVLVGTVGYTLVAAFFASLMVSAMLASRQSLERRVWCSRPLRFFGRYSYALYVVHPTVIYFWPSSLSASELWDVTGILLPAFLLSSALMTTVCVALALLSWHLLEKHFLRLRFRLAVAPGAFAS